MSLIKPFRGLRPATGRAAEVAAPPYDVLSADEARARVGNRPWSFLHISKAEIDLPPETDHYSPQVYAKSRENFDRMIAEGVLRQDEAPCYYAYRLVMGEHVQTGLVATASVADYDTNRIRKHEIDLDVTASRELARLLQRHRRDLGRRHLQALFGQPHRVAPLAIGDRKRARAGRQQRPLRSEKTVGQRAEDIVLAGGTIAAGPHVFLFMCIHVVFLESVGTARAGGRAWARAETSASTAGAARAGCGYQGRCSPR